MSRRTGASVFIRATNASKAASARDSWKNPTIAFTRTTPKITPASTYSPRSEVTAVAARSGIVR